MRESRFLIVGGGSIGQRHARNLQAAGHAVDFVEPAASKKAELQSAFGSTVHPDLEAALRSEYRAVLVCNPTSMHLDAATACLRKKIPLFIEKPLASGADGLDAFVRLAEKQKVPVLVGCNLRFTRSLRRVKQLLDDGVIGRLLSARVEFGSYLPDWRPQTDYRTGYSAQKSQGGGIVLDAIHELDYVRWLVGAEPAAVSAVCARLGGLEIDVEDTAEITLGFYDGPDGARPGNAVLAQIHLDYLSRDYRRNGRWLGTDGTIEWDYVAQTVRHYDARTKKWSSEAFSEQPNDMYVRELEHFIAILDGTQAPAQDARAAATVLRTALAALESSEKRKSVTLSP